ncbi:polyphosphate polymerase domain-containing protein [Actinomadura sp. 7K507]|uniref:polyphosphate polymerase domain-containing protein n=1 Tax=Actinomadura sp. 7K507 TaxID=2530365 RepID=UPI00104378BF|nr:polyphosphate polymerase domain-containing protein [Actinomadura sp. 7K507]TDC74359.1 polyphosphate polymerase domain-containing protein [Actinomadura sp. 7K507]
MTADGASALAGLTEALPPMGLPQVLERAELQTRVDRKYLVPAAVCEAILPRLGGEYAALEIGGRRRFRYSSTYFDTPDLLTFRQHRQGRRHRFKIRTRAYLDSGECAFELKLAGVRNVTDKRRMPYEVTRREELDGAARAFLEEVLLDAYRVNAPDTVVPSATTGYLRSTLVQLSGPGRVTLDAGLTCTRDGAGKAADPGMVLIESKSERADAPVDRILRELGVRPAKMSKYCVAVAVLYPEMHANPWHAAMRACFDRDGGGLPFSRPGTRGR